jgi:hypothetical protein
LRDKIAAVSTEILKIAGAKIINHRKAGVRKSFLQGKGEIRADETGATRDDEIGRRVGRRHKNLLGD